MGGSAQIGVIGDFNPKFDHHHAIDASLAHAAAKLGIQTIVRWVPTDSICDDPAVMLEHFDGIWISSGSPYKSMEGALHSIRFARRRNLPLFAT